MYSCFMSTVLMDEGPDLRLGFSCDMCALCEIDTEQTLNLSVRQYTINDLVVEIFSSGCS